MPITRREFIHGVGVTAALALCPASAGASLSADEELRRCSRAGLEARLPGVPGPHVYRARLERELDALTHLGFSSRLLLVHEVVRRARRQGIPVGPGLGRLPNSLTLWALGITEIDPIALQLPFEMLVNTQRRPVLGWFDVEFCARRRDEVVDFILRRYRAAHAALARTEDDRTVVALAMAAPAEGEFSPVEFRERWPAPQPPVAHVFAVDHELRRMCATDDALRRWRKRAGEYERDAEAWMGSDWDPGATVVFGAESSATRDARGRPVAKVDRWQADQAGLITFQARRLRALSVIADCAQPPGILDDRAYAVLGRGEVGGFPGIDSDGRALLLELRPSCFEDVAAFFALNRPGPMEEGLTGRFVAAKREAPAARDQHPAVAYILARTYGCLVYSDQVLQIAHAVAGIDLERADLLRRALGKRKDVESWAEEFVAGARLRGSSAATASRVFQLLEHETALSFCRGHAVCEAVIALKLARRRAHAPHELDRALARSC
jgi:DNA polymerase-3 subunit alpha